MRCQLTRKRNLAVIWKNVPVSGFQVGDQMIATSRSRMATVCLHFDPIHPMLILSVRNAIGAILVSFDDDIFSHT